jgi:hypothetical protein
MSLNTDKNLQIADEKELEGFLSRRRRKAFAEALRGRHNARLMPLRRILVRISTAEAALPKKGSGHCLGCRRFVGYFNAILEARND